MAKFSDRLNQLRVERGMSLAELAKALGCAKSTVNMYERGEREPKYERLEEIADYFNVDLDYLHGKSDIRNKSLLLHPEMFSHKDIKPIEKRRIPLLGNVACGEPSYAEEDYTYSIEAGANVDADFALRASGDSMINARIHDGDIVFVKKTEMVNDGEIAVVLIGDEATLKRVYYDRENNVLQLVPENPACRIQWYRGEELNAVRILGKAVGGQYELK